MPKDNRVERITFRTDGERRLKDFLKAELRASSQDHEKMVLKWKEYEKSYDALPDAIKKNFPFRDASNLVAPVVAIHTEAIFARIINTIFGVDPLWSVRPLRRDYTDVAKPTEQYLHWKQRYQIKLYERVVAGLKQIVKLGTGVLLAYHDTISKRILHYDEQGNIQKRGEVVLYRGPVVEFIRGEDFFVPSDAGEDSAATRWVAHRRHPTWYELKRKEHSRQYRNVEQIKNFMEKQPEAMEEFRKEQFGVNARMPELGRYETFVWWGDYDINGDGLAEQCRFVYHDKSDTLLDATYNFLLDGRRPYVPLRYMVREGSFWGEGVGYQIASLQRAYSTQINQAIDNATISNTKMFKGRKGAVRQDEEIWAGKMWLLNRMDDLEAFEMGDSRSGSILAALGFIKELSELRTGVSDYGLGRESAIVGHRATATSTLALIQEGNKRFDLAIRDARYNLSELGMHLLLLDQQYGEDQIDYYHPVTGEQSQYKVPSAYARLGLGLEITASSASINREVEKQNTLALFNLVTQFYGRLFELAAIIARPEVPSELKQFGATLAEKSGKLLERVLQAYAVPDPETFEVDMNRLAASAGGMSGGNGGPPGVPGGVGPGGVEGAAVPPLPGAYEGVPPQGRGQPGQAGGGVPGVPR